MAATAEEAAEITGNTMLSIVAERRMAIKQPRISSAAQLEGRRHPTAKPEPGKIFLSKATEPKPERETPVHVGNRQAPTTVPVAAETVVAEAEGIGLAIAAHPPAPVPREAQWVMAQAGAAGVRRAPAVHAAVPA